MVGKLEGADRSIAQFLMSSSAFVSADKTHIRLETDGFAATMLGTDAAKNAVSAAFARAHLTDGRALVEIKVRTAASRTASPADALGDLL